MPDFGVTGTEGMEPTEKGSPDRIAQPKAEGPDRSMAWRLRWLGGRSKENHGRRRRNREILRHGRALRGRLRMTKEVSPAVAGLSPGADSGCSQSVHIPEQSCRCAWGMAVSRHALAVRPPFGFRELSPVSNHRVG